MAVEPASNEPVSQDFTAHRRDYAGFVRLFTVGAAACLVIGIVVLFIIA